MNNKKIKTFIREKSVLFWDIKESERENISRNLLVERILSFGNEKDVKKLFELLGIDETAKIFYSRVVRNRVNYKKRTINFFNLYFRRHASKNIIKKPNQTSTKRCIKDAGFQVDSILYENHEQIHLIINSVKVTFFHYEYDIEPSKCFSDLIKLPSLLDLATMKVFALGKRAKWKDYADLYFILKNHITFENISIRTKENFGNLYNEKLFREQLSYFDDIDYSDKIEYIGIEPNAVDIKKFLTKISTQDL